MSENLLLLDEISEKLNIKQGIFENTDLWRQRIIYSAIGFISLGSLFDREEDSSLVSITHFKNKVKSLFYAYNEIYPDIMKNFNINSDDLAQEIYDIYRYSGFIYYSPNRISMAKETKAKCGEITCIRGAKLGRDVFVSGLGTYSELIYDDISADVRNIFRFSEEHFEIQYKDLESYGDWRVFDTKPEIEYLNLNPPFSQGYWKKTPDKYNCISLMRYKIMNYKSYYLYKYENGKYFQKALHLWLVENSEHIKLSNIILYNKNTLPKIKYSYLGDIVKIKINYLLPKSELYFLKVYSWPENFEKSLSVFNRVMYKKIFEYFKEHLESIGYKFIKE